MRRIRTSTAAGGVGDYSQHNKYAQEYYTYHSISEPGAMHIENMVRGELQKSIRFKTILVHQFYVPGFVLTSEMTPNGKRIYNTGPFGVYDIFEKWNSSQEYYKQTFNIYEELFTVPDYSELIKSLRSGKLYY
jgi:hypothetical protein